MHPANAPTGSVFVPCVECCTLFERKHKATVCCSTECKTSRRATQNAIRQREWWKKKKGTGYRAEYFRANKKAQAWPKCEVCVTISRRLPDVGCLECYARDCHLREWSPAEIDVLERYAGKDGAARLQLRLYRVTGEPRTRGAIRMQLKKHNISSLSNQDGYTVAQIAKVTGRSYTTIQNFIRAGGAKNIGNCNRILVSLEDGERLIKRYTDKGAPSYTIDEAAKMIGCSKCAIRRAIKRGAPSWKNGHIRVVPKSLIDRAVRYLRDTGEIYVPWRSLVER